jgi:hypothetical protein
MVFDLFSHEENESKEGIFSFGKEFDRADTVVIVPFIRDMGHILMHLREGENGEGWALPSGQAPIAEKGVYGAADAEMNYEAGYKGEHILRVLPYLTVRDLSKKDALPAAVFLCNVPVDLKLRPRKLLKPILSEIDLTQLPRNFAFANQFAVISHIVRTLRNRGVL